MSEHSQLPQLIPLGGSDGAYCDLETGECYPATTSENSAQVAVDPVCKMEVAIATAQYTTSFQGQTYYFCSMDCLKAFEKEPQRYLTGESRPSL
ncbi:MAG: YHS domain-containing protein [Anaerolineaceae bacterium]